MVEKRAICWIVASKQTVLYVYVYLFSRKERKEIRGSKRSRAEDRQNEQKKRKNNHNLKIHVMVLVCHPYLLLCHAGTTARQALQKYIYILTNQPRINQSSYKIT